MAFDNSFTAVTGQTYTASQYNTHTKGNFTAVWVGTTAGDVDYYTGSTSKNRLAGVNGGVLKSTASAISWVSPGSTYDILRIASGQPVFDKTLQFCALTKTANQSFSSGSSAAITFNNELIDTNNWHDNSTNPSRVTVAEAGWYIPFAYILFFRGGGSGNFHLTAEFKLNGAATGSKNRIYESIDANGKQFTLGGIPIQMSASQYLEVFFDQDSGASGDISSGVTATTFAVLRIG